MSNYKLHMKKVIKNFSGVRALDKVDFTLEAGEVHALVGMNGAGKSTLIKILSGVYGKDGGTILLDGEQIDIRNPQDAMKLGIATVYQDPEMIPSFTGYENIFLGFESERTNPFARINRKKLREKAEEILVDFPIEIDLTTPIKDLGAVEQEVVAVLRALSHEREMKILILDEPTSILTEKEKEVLFRLIKTLQKRGISIIYISHRLGEIDQVADRITVIRNGKNVATISTKDENTGYSQIAELMVGEKLDSLYPPKSGRPEEEIINIAGMSLEGKFSNVSFSARRGEIVGLFGLVGSGVEELAKVLFGIFTPTSGTITINDQRVQINSSADAIREGIFLIPGDRRGEGLFEIEPISFNVTIGRLRRVLSKIGLVQRQNERRSTQSMVDDLAIATPGINQKVGFLSGGNQQKVVIAKGLYTQARIYIFVEPTAGVDVGAKTGIYKLIRQLSEKSAIIIASSDCEEIYGMCDKVVTLLRGEVTMQSDIANVRMEEILLSGVRGRG